jgi:hypothetical protein
LVTDVVAERVVDLFEIVKVEEHRNGGVPTAPGPSEHQFNPIEDQGSIGQLGESVVQGLELQLFGSLRN